jgi:hypothetical protein
MNHLLHALCAQRVGVHFGAEDQWEASEPQPGSVGA